MTTEGPTGNTTGTTTGSTRHPGTAPFTGLGLDGSQVQQLLRSTAALQALAGLPLTFTVLGLDRLVPVSAAEEADSSGPESASTPPARAPGLHLDSSIAATYLAASGPDIPLVLPYAPQRDHPYNLARRAQSADLLAHGTTGVLIGQADRAAPAGRVWGTTASQAEAAADAATLLAALGQSWPADTVVADRARDVFVESDRIRRVDHTGVFDSAGPLSAPTSEQTSPVLFWYAAGPGEALLAPEAVDVVVLAGATEAGVGQIAARTGPARRLLVQVDPAQASRGPALRDAGADGILIAAPGAPLQDLLAELAGLIDRARSTGAPGTPTAVSRPAPLTLRERLGLPQPPDRLSDAAPAFASPLGASR
ncbi:hypothetical protein [Sediminivirga luteola]|uniref:hypothetical protein n=1 Tax=Sediminivirga luteola TaxID=1774748 RepID=UPI001F57ED44|nr:hypothetical protein [Sediminivirga luteola]MCI2266332.1 hypothetical protein [Sediminivirga luteola]